ncbi:C-type lectin domain family 17, member A-like [Thalassophryne amazonica]|uniref:C-type lectin domain family 17, member A-like n=1 Tax=Thalassophryne amazonica TaxID=390379 RepID=UPI0014722602|nr:C-type lectin domain family 17, member A-like [Thalassophryne amazonica]
MDSLLFWGFFSAHCQCQEGWRLYEGRCYYFSTDAKTWLEANAYCLGRNANLMSIQNIHERLWVSTQIDDDIYWIGLNDRVTEGTWEWSDGSPYLEFLEYVIFTTTSSSEDKT